MLTKALVTFRLPGMVLELVQEPGDPRSDWSAGIPREGGQAHGVDVLDVTPPRNASEQKHS